MKYIHKAFQFGPKYLTIEIDTDELIDEKRKLYKKTTPMIQLESYGATILDKERFKEL